MNKIMEFIKFASETGLPLPTGRDTARPGSPPSVTLFFLYVANCLAFLSLICLHFRADALVATSATCLYGVTWTIFYLIRNLQKAKVDFSDQSFELEGEDETPKEKE